MKTNNWLLIFIWILLACGSKEKSAIKESVAPENLASVTLHIEGMVCEMGCARTIEEEVGSMEGVQECKVDFQHKTAVCAYDKAHLSAQEIVEKINQINDGQYKAVVIESGSRSQHASERQQMMLPEEDWSLNAFIPHFLIYLVSKFVH